MERRAVLAAILAIVLALAVVPSRAAGPGRQQARLIFHQYGVVVGQINAADPFEIRGEGFRPSFPVSICFSGDACLMSEVDPEGLLHQSRAAMPAGTYMVTASQPRNRTLETWLLKSAGKVTVTN